MLSMLKKQDSLLSSGLASRRHSLPFKATLKNDRAADQALKTHNETNSKAIRRAQQNLHSQYASLNNRLSARISTLRSLSPKSANKGGHTDKVGTSMNVTSSGKKYVTKKSLEGESDRSAGGCKDSQIEEIMEKYVIEKLQRTHDVKLRYKAGKEEVEEMGSSVMLQQVFEQMELRMNQEIKEIEDDINRRRKQEIQELKRFSTVN